MSAKPQQTVRAVAVVGAGTMGPGIAQTFARHGCAVRLYDKDPAALERALPVIRDSTDLFVKVGLLPAAERDAVLARVQPAANIADAVAGVDLVVEAIVENKEAKLALFREIDALCGQETIFASNTSYLNVFDGAPRPTRTVITHWFAPPHILPLVEVVRGPETADDVVTTVVHLLRAAGKVPVLLQRFLPGFAVNRLQRALGNEMFYLLDNGYITPEDLDLAVKASIAPRMVLLGLAQRYDFAGLDLIARNLQNPGYTEAPLVKRPACLFRSVEEGNYGVKTGKGFFDYSGRDLAAILAERDERLLHIIRAAEPYQNMFAED